MKTRRRSDRFVAAALAAVMTASVFPKIVSTGEEVLAYGYVKEQANTALRTQNIKGPKAPPSRLFPWEGSYIWFGHYNGQPTKYRVLNPDETRYGGKTMLIDSDEILFESELYADGSELADYDNWEDKMLGLWSGSTLRKTLNGKSFLDNKDVFTAAEKNAIHVSEVEPHSLTAGEDFYQVSPTTQSRCLIYMPLNDRVFLLDAEEASNPLYGYSNDEYSLYQCRAKYINGAYEGWWLRSGTINFEDVSAAVETTGDADFADIHDTYGVAPAMNISKPTILYSTLVAGIDESTGAGAEYKLTVIDPDAYIRIPNDMYVTRDKYSAYVPYVIGGKNAANYETMTVLITDKQYGASDASIIYYDKISVDGDSFDLGSAHFAIPDILTGEWGKDYHVYIAAEDRKDAHETDYVTAPVEVPKPLEQVFINFYDEETVVCDYRQITALGKLVSAGLVGSEMAQSPYARYIDLDNDGNYDLATRAGTDTLEKLMSANISYAVFEPEQLATYGYYTIVIQFVSAIPTPSVTPKPSPSPKIEPITNVSVNIPEPIGGNSPASTAVSESTEYYVRTVQWFENGTDIEILPESAFAEGTYYYVEMTLKANENYKFFDEDEITALINGRPVDYMRITDGGELEISIDFAKAAKPTAAPTPTEAATPTATATPIAKPTDMTAPTATPTSKPDATATTGPTVKVTATPTATAAVTVTATPTPTTVPEKDSKALISEFVERIYIYVLDREPEAEGAAFWSDELYSFRRTGAEVAQGFIFSPEFESRNTSDKEFITILYKTFFGRDPEENGMNFWLDQLASGTMDRVTVANGFIYSQEWADTCASYGIRSGGDLKPTGKIKPTELTYAFVERMYTTAMGRGYDEEGRQYWASELANFNITGEVCGASFFLSQEMENYKLSDKEYLGRLYATFMNREPDADGEAYWLGVMASGASRADVVFGFTRSPEFTEKCIEARILPY